MNTVVRAMVAESAGSEPTSNRHDEGIPSSDNLQEPGKREVGINERGEGRRGEEKSLE